VVKIDHLPSSKLNYMLQKIYSFVDSIFDFSIRDCIFGVMIPFNGSNSNIGIVYDNVMYVYVLDM
jgi:hypothetical protein